MRYVYAHFPINVNVEKNGETGLFEVEIRYVYTTKSGKLDLDGVWLAWAEE